jgi:hypothetical protein
MTTDQQLKRIGDRITLLEVRFKVMSEAMDKHLECIGGLRNIVGNILEPKLPKKKVAAKRAHRRE